MMPALARRGVVAIRVSFTPPWKRGRTPRATTSRRHGKFPLCRKRSVDNTARAEYGVQCPDIQDDPHTSSIAPLATSMDGPHEPG